MKAISPNGKEVICKEKIILDYFHREYAGDRYAVFTAAPVSVWILIFLLTSEVST